MTPPARHLPFDAAQAVRLAQDTFDIEAAAVLGLKSRTGAAFAQAVQQISPTAHREAETAKAHRG